ncbi:glutamate--tRNA ligase [Candidatus Gracilibacteria bacterium]|nr:glutamate--tRNA ligase [Candidatus Gracilibacteria bacterium]MCF7819195.1 glutamate--tRNA ligase [Candidatus Gracilibacteria bacterium]
MEKEKTIIVRMPPSPTGNLHLGTARTALFNYLFAKKKKGEIVFRWEDTDKERSKKEFEKEILNGFKWLGIDFESEASAFHRQTENLSVHKKHLETLWEAKKIFPCFTPPEEIQKKRIEATQKKKNFVFWSPYRDISQEEAREKIKQEIPFVWRLRVNSEAKIIFEDIIRGAIETSTETLGDFVVARSDGSVLYLLANVIDDATQGITHVLRGEDHISNTPKQILLYQALGFPLPQFGHIPLVLDQKKRKLSKRNVDPETCVLIADFQKQGFLPEAVVNGLAFLGWNPKSTQELFFLEDLIQAFSLENINPGAAQYDFEKMKWFNTKWIRQINIQKLIDHFNEFSGTSYSFPKHEKAFEVAREKSRNLLDISAQIDYLLDDPGFEKTLLQNEKLGQTTEAAQRILESVEDFAQNIPEQKWNASFLREEAVKKIEALEIKNGEFLSPFRIALANRAVSAGPFEIAEVIGKAETLRRIQRARD